MDWRLSGNTPAVMDQGYLCASCWANSAVAAVEAAMSIAYNVSASVLAFSRQVIVDCANADNFGQDYFQDAGCNGALNRGCLSSCMVR